MDIAGFLHFYPSWDFSQALEYAENHHEFEDSLNNQYNLTLLLSHLLFLDIDSQVIYTLDQFYLFSVEV